jgi:hypothetical protein
VPIPVGSGTRRVLDIRTQIAIPTRGRGVPRRGRGPRGHGGHTGGGRGRSGPPRTDSRPQCQLCGRKEHTVMECWHHFDKNFTPDDKYAGAAATSYGRSTIDTGGMIRSTSPMEQV